MSMTMDTAYKLVSADKLRNVLRKRLITARSQNEVKRVYYMLNHINRYINWLSNK